MPWRRSGSAALLLLSGRAIAWAKASSTKPRASVNNSSCQRAVKLERQTDLHNSQTGFNQQAWMKLGFWYWIAIPGFLWHCGYEKHRGGIGGHARIHHAISTHQVEPLRASSYKPSEEQAREAILPEEKSQKLLMN
ncbi:hypothetical protein EYF80_023415 [Liparis tanakae]|uniref:Secreted protein n=1 Tax=Liparis tanakae TaxID=230148 RepID=A0A4Z2HKR9_9TELE|nr:hypothetical protein EYF80_023415 [Liparis tanakae]